MARICTQPAQVSDGAANDLEVVRAECEQENDRDRNADEPKQDGPHY